MLFENSVPISRLGIARSSKLSLSAEALERAVEGMQSAEEPAACSGLYTNAGISIDWKPLAGSQKFRIYASSQNPGALQLTEELSRLLQRLGIELEVTTSVEDVATCSHMLLYLDARTWSAVEGERRVEGLTDEVKAAMRRRVHLLLVHETEPFEYLEPDAAERHAGVKFDDLLDSVDGATPIELLQRKVTGRTNALNTPHQRLTDRQLPLSRPQVYSEVAVPLKDGIYRPASLLLLARAASEPHIKPSRREASSRFFSTRTLPLPPRKARDTHTRFTVPESSGCTHCC